MDRVQVDIGSMDTEGIWLHFDTDFISDAENPAVDYRLPDGLTFEEAGHVLESLFATGKIVGMSVSIFNPSLDQAGSITRRLVRLLSNSIFPLQSMQRKEALGKNFHSSS